MAKKGVVEINERKEAWFRIIVLFVSGLIFCIWRYIIYVFVVINWLITVFSGKRNEDIAMFSEYFNTEVYKFMRYMTFVSNKRPFPFTMMERISKFS
jgi:hypothetical protein